MQLTFPWLIFYNAIIYGGRLFSEFYLVSRFILVWGTFLEFFLVASSEINQNVVCSYKALMSLWITECLILVGFDVTYCKLLHHKSVKLANRFIPRPLVIIFFYYFLEWLFYQTPTSWQTKKMPQECQLIRSSWKADQERGQTKRSVLNSTTDFDEQAMVQQVSNYCILRSSPL